MLCCYIAVLSRNDDEYSMHICLNFQPCELVGLHLEFVHNGINTEKNETEHSIGLLATLITHSISHVTKYEIMSSISSLQRGYDLPT